MGLVVSDLRLRNLQALEQGEAEALEQALEQAYAYAYAEGNLGDVAKP